jgi:hypothetical protein
VEDLATPATPVLVAAAVTPVTVAQADFLDYREFLVLVANQVGLEQVVTRASLVLAEFQDLVATRVLLVNRVCLAPLV